MTLVCGTTEYILIHCVFIVYLKSDVYHACATPMYFPALINAWKLISPCKSFVVIAATGTEKKEWMAHIRTCFNDLLTKRMLNSSCF